MTGGVVGTVAYMAPEQAGGEGAGPAADVYAACLVVYEGLTGANPVAGGIAGRDRPPRRGRAPCRRWRALRPDLPAAPLRGDRRRPRAATRAARPAAAELADALGRGAGRARAAAAPRRGARALPVLGRRGGRARRWPPWRGSRRRTANRHARVGRLARPGVAAAADRPPPRSPSPGARARRRPLAVVAGAVLVGSPRRPRRRICSAPVALAVAAHRLAHRPAAAAARRRAGALRDRPRAAATPRSRASCRAGRPASGRPAPGMVAALGWQVAARSRRAAGGGRAPGVGRGAGWTSGSSPADAGRAPLAAPGRPARGAGPGRGPGGRRDVRARWCCARAPAARAWRPAPPGWRPWGPRWSRPRPDAADALASLVPAARDRAGVGHAGPGGSSAGACPRGRPLRCAVRPHEPPARHRAEDRGTLRAQLPAGVPEQPAAGRARPQAGPRDGGPQDGLGLARLRPERVHGLPGAPGPRELRHLRAVARRPSWPPTSTPTPARAGLSLVAPPR